MITVRYFILLKITKLKLFVYVKCIFLYYQTQIHKNKLFFKIICLDFKNSTVLIIVVNEEIFGY